MLRAAVTCARSQEGEAGDGEDAENQDGGGEEEAPDNGDDGADEEEEATGDEERFELSPMSAPWLRRADWDDVAKTIVFSTCYGGLFQPHWFNVLNSYDWSTAIIPEQVDIQMRAMIEAVSRGQYLPGLDP